MREPHSSSVVSAFRRIETLVTTVLTERAGTTTIVMRIIFPSREVRDIVLKGGLTQKGMTEFYARLDELLKTRPYVSIA